MLIDNKSYLIFKSNIVEIFSDASIVDIKDNMMAGKKDTPPSLEIAPVWLFLLLILSYNRLRLDIRTILGIMITPI